MRRAVEAVTKRGNGCMTSSLSATAAPHTNLKEEPRISRVIHNGTLAFEPLEPELHVVAIERALLAGGLSFSRANSMKFTSEHSLDEATICKAGFLEQSTSRAALRLTSRV